MDNNLTLNIQLATFNGPLDVLISLTQEHKMDILHLDVAQLAEQYLIYIQKHIKQINIDQACEYLTMATYLVELKSKKILPNDDVTSTNDFEYERDKLIKRISEYNEYKKVVNRLVNKQDQRLVMYAKSADDLDEYTVATTLAELPTSIDTNRLLKAIQNAFVKWKFNLFTQKKILIQELSVDDVKTDIINFVNQPKFTKSSFSKFLNSVDELKISEQYIVTCFLALLELVKYQHIVLTQDVSDDEIYFTKNKNRTLMTDNVKM
ncbi:MAG: segregation/condensation protein A [Mycoplasmataceae bacterium]|nr:segregation/condensation protein A [Mycoplasmataceae bacterium]